MITAFVIMIASFQNSRAESGSPAAPVSASEEALLFQEIPSVYSASKYEQKVTEAPSSVSIVTASDIKKYGYRTLADVLRGVRSFFVTYDRNYNYVGVRGFGRPADYNNRILLLIDGHRTNDNLYDMAFIGTDGILDVDIIDRVEIIRGPGSSLYGSNALFAVVNVITKRGRDLKGMEVSGEAARYDTYKGRLSYGDRYSNGIEALFSGTVYDSKGPSLFFPEYNSPTTNHGLTSGTDYDRFHSLFVKTSYRDFTLQAASLSRIKGIPTGSFETDFNNPDNRTRDQRAYLDLQYDHAITAKNQVSARLFYDYYKYTGDYITSGVTNKDRGLGEWWGGEIKLSSRSFNNHRLIVGTEYTFNNHLDQRNHDVYPYGVYLDDQRRSEFWAAYIQDEITLIRKKLVFNAGLRYDNYNTFTDTLNPRLALIYTPWGKSIFKALFGTAFRAPSPFELYYQSPTNSPNADLKPERISTYEVVYEQYLGDHCRATAAGFFYKIYNLIDQMETAPGSGITIFRNLGQIQSHGFEIELENKWANGIEGRISYAFQKTVDLATDGILSNSPEHMVKANLILPLWRNKLFAGVEQQYTSLRKTIDNSYTSEFFITNITLFAQRMAKGLELSASVYNVFNTRYSDPVSADFMPVTAVQQDQRAYRVKLTYAF